MTSVERLGPHSIEAEEAVLGSVLINPEAMTVVSDFLEPGDFFELKHAWIYQTMLTMQERGQAIDSLILVEALRNQGKLEDIGGPAYITYLVNSTPTHIYAETYGRIIEIAAFRRRLMAAAGEIAQLARAESAELDQVIADVTTVFNTAIQRQGDHASLALSDATDAYYQRVEKMQRDPKGSVLGFPTGLHSLDRYLTRLERGGLYLVAARPKVGKTTLLLNISRYLVKRGAKVLFVSLEMSSDELCERMVSAESKIPSDKLRTADLEPDDWDVFTTTRALFDTWPFFIEDTASLAPTQLRIIAQRQARTYGLDAICVDYIQLMRPDLRDRYKDGTKEQEVASISRGLKQLAREMNVPVLAACQINRAGIGEPETHHLKDSGALEADADGVILLWEDTSNPNGLHVKVAAHRHGPTGKIEPGLFYQKAIHHIACMTR